MIYDESRQIVIVCLKIRPDFAIEHELCIRSFTVASLKALSHGAIFHATSNAILHLRDVN